LLKGDPPDLAYLTAALPVGDAQVIKDGDRFYMTSKEADNVADAQVPEVPARSSHASTASDVFRTPASGPLSSRTSTRTMEELPWSEPPRRLRLGPA
jgi:hypothetical protein